MGAPNYFLDRLTKLQDLAKADALVRDRFKDNVLVLPDRRGAFIRPTDFPCLVIVPEHERHGHYSSRTALQCVVTVQVWGFVDPQKPEESLKEFLGLVALTTKFLWRNNQTTGFWWAINPEQELFLDWSYQTVAQDVENGQLAVRSEAEVRLVEAKINLAA